MSAVEDEVPMTEQPQVTEAQAISPPALALAQQLGETKFHVLHQLERCLLVLGEATVDELLRETEQIEQGDGLLTQDGKRRRTKGGVFLYLARGRCTPEQRAIIFPRRIGRRARRPAKHAHPAPLPPHQHQRQQRQRHRSRPPIFSRE